jgi:hypothetical protein
MDIIKLSDKDLTKMRGAYIDTHSSKENQIIISETVLNNLAIKDFVLLRNDMSNVVTHKYNLETKELTVREEGHISGKIIKYILKFDKKDDRLTITYKNSLISNDKGKTYSSLTAESNPELFSINTYINAALTYVSINYFIMNCLPAIEVKETKETRTIESKSNGKKTINHVTNLIKHIKLKENFDEIVSSIHHAYTCPAWRVRGHYRHLVKQNRDVYVHPHVKGKMRDQADKIIDKTYKAQNETEENNYDI